MIGLRKTPMPPSISTSTTSPGFIHKGGLRAKPTPSGVPVDITSPATSGVQSEQYETKVGMSKILAILSESSSLYCLHPARAQAACQGVDRHLSKLPTFTARWRRSANRVVKGPSPKGTATARLRRFQTFLPSSRNKEVRPFPDFRPGVSNRILCNGRTYQDAPETSTCRRCIKCVLTRPAPFASPRRQPNGCPRLCWVLLLRKEI
jgi:hypothetical protein